MNYEYIFSGTLPPDAPSYVKRKADHKLYQGLKAGKFCYVLNSRQTGKSSLRVQVMRQLIKDGVACAVIDLSMDGTQNVTLEQWYANLIRSLVTDFALDIDLSAWWIDHAMLSPQGRFREFIESILLPKVNKNIVIFIDEIDSVLSLKFPTDDFFAFIRACYNQRVDKPEYNRLTFALLGVATPSDLIKDKKRTPFNIGHAIALNGFKFHEAQPLITGFINQVNNPQAVLKEVLAWTGGQPFLTQKLCQLVCSSKSTILAGGETFWVEELVRLYIIENWEAQDEPEHLKTIRDRLLNDPKRISRLLGLYQQLLPNLEIKADDSSEQMELRLSGLVVIQKGKLSIHNRIYASVFNQVWVDKALNNLRPYGEAITAWLASKGQDESQLLRGQTLNDSMAWALNKSLSDQDYHFLTASQVLEKRKVQKALDEVQKYAEARRAGKLNRALAVTTKETVFEALDYLTPESFKYIVSNLELDFGVINQTLSMMDSMVESQGFDTILNDMLRSITFKTSELLGADRTTIYLLDEEKNELWSIVAMGEDDVPLTIQMPVGKGIAGQVAKYRKAINIPYDFYNDPRSTPAKEQDQKTGYRTYNQLALPLLNEQGDLVAVVQFINKLKPYSILEAPLSERLDRDGFTQKDQELFSNFAPSIQLILKSFKMFYKAAQKQRAASALMKATQSLGLSKLDLGETLKMVINEATKLMNADSGSLWLLNDERNELCAQISMADGTLKEIRIPRGAGFAGHVATTKQPLIIPFDLYDHPNSETAKQVDQQTGYRTCSLLCMPVFNADGELIAVTQLVNKKKQGDFAPYNPADWPKAPECWRATFNANDQEFMAAFNIQAGVALQNATLFNTVKQQQLEQLDLASNVSNGVIFTDRAGKITLANPSAKNLLGLRDLEGKSVRDLIRLKERDFSQLFDDALIAKDERTRQQDYPDQTLLSHGTEAEHHVNLCIISFPMMNDRTLVSSTLIIINDSSDEKQNQEKEDLLRNVSSRVLFAEDTGN
jgi:adenylate cyclase